MYPSARYWKIGFPVNVVWGPTKIYELKLYTLDANGDYLEVAPDSFLPDTGCTDPQNAFDGNASTYYSQNSYTWTNGLIAVFNNPVSLYKIEVTNNPTDSVVLQPGCVQLFHSQDNVTWTGNLGYTYITSGDYSRFESELGVKNKFSYSHKKQIGFSQPAGVYESLELSIVEVKVSGEIYTNALANSPSTVIGYDRIPSIENSLWDEVYYYLPQPLRPFTGTRTVYAMMGIYGIDLPTISATYTVNSLPVKVQKPKGKFWRLSFINKPAGTDVVGAYSLRLCHILPECKIGNSDIGHIQPKNIIATGITSVQNVLDPSPLTYAQIPANKDLVATMTFEYETAVEMVSLILDNRTVQAVYTPGIIKIECTDDVTNGPWLDAGYFKVTNNDYYGGANFSNTYGWIILSIQPRPRWANGAGIYSGGLTIGMYMMESIFALYKDQSYLITYSLNDEALPDIDSDPFVNWNIYITETTKVNIAICYAPTGEVVMHDSIVFVIAGTVPQFLLKNGVAADLVTDALPGELLVTTDETSLHFGDFYGGVEQASQVYIGDTQPLSNKKIWVDKANMELKYNTGTAWEAKTADSQPTDLGGFIDVVHSSQPSGNIASNKFIELTSEQGYDIYYTIDGSTPTTSSTAYTGPIAAFTGTLKALSFDSLNTPSELLELAYVSVVPKVMSVEYTSENPAITATDVFFQVNFDTSLLSVNAGVYYSSDPLTQTDVENWGTDRDLFPNTPAAPITTDYSVPRTGYFVLADTNYNILERLEVYCTAAPIAITMDPVISEGDPVIVYLDRPANGWYWYVLARYGGGTPNAAYQICQLDSGDTSIDISSYLHPGDYSIAIACYRSLDAEPLKTWTMSNVLTFTNPGVYTPPTPPVIWEGYGVTFDKPGDTDPTVIQDIVTSNVVITRDIGNNGIYNIQQEAYYNYYYSPKGTMWAFMGLGLNADKTDPATFISNNHAEMFFQYFYYAALEGRASEMVGIPAVVHLTDDNIFIDAKITRYDTDGYGGFEWTRSTSTSTR